MKSRSAVFATGLVVCALCSCHGLKSSQQSSGANACTPTGTMSGWAWNTLERRAGKALNQDEESDEQASLRAALSVLATEGKQILLVDRPSVFTDFNFLVVFTLTTKDSGQLCGIHVVSDGKLQQWYEYPSGHATVRSVVKVQGGKELEDLYRMEVVDGGIGRPETGVTNFIYFALVDYGQGPWMIRVRCENSAGVLSSSGFKDLSAFIQNGYYGIPIPQPVICEHLSEQLRSPNMLNVLVALNVLSDIMDDGFYFERKIGDENMAYLKELMKSKWPWVQELAWHLLGEEYPRPKHET